jgi:hypothetical protein
MAGILVNGCFELIFLFSAHPQGAGGCPSSGK